MGRLRVDHGKEIYFEQYPGERTVVLSHGWGMGCRVWDDSVARLVDAGFGVVTYDHRGCGASDKDFQDVSIEALGADLAHALPPLAVAATGVGRLVVGRRGGGRCRCPVGRWARRLGVDWRRHAPIHPGGGFPPRRYAGRRRRHGCRLRADRVNS